MKVLASALIGFVGGVTSMAVMVLMVFGLVYLVREMLTDLPFAIHEDAAFRGFTAGGLLFVGLVILVTNAGRA